MKKLYWAVLLLGGTASFAGCSNEAATVNDEYRATTPRETASGPTGTSSSGGQGTGAGNSQSAPRPAPME